MKTPSKPAVIGYGLVFVGALATECYADPFGAHDALPRSAFAIGATGTTSSISVGSYVAIYPSNVVTDEDYMSALLTTPTKPASSSSKPPMPELPFRINR